MRTMSSAGRVDTAATMHTMMAAVASLSLGMVAPPGAHMGGSANQGLGLNNSTTCNYSQGYNSPYTPYRGSWYRHSLDTCRRKNYS
jgi:hypothetical protein